MRSGIPMAFWVCVALVSVGCPSRSVHNAEAPATAFVGINVVPMDREVVLEDFTVVVAGDRIERMGPTAEIRIPRGVTVIDGTGRYLMPGLTDMQVHLDRGAHVEDTTILLLLVANGVTTVRNMEGRPIHLEWRRRIREGDFFGPTLYTTGPKTAGQPPVFPRSATHRHAAIEASGERHGPADAS